MSARARFQRVNPWRDLAGLPREVWVLFLATLVNKAGTMVLPFLVLYLTRDLRLSLGSAGFVVTVYGAGALVAAPVSGWLSDRFGPIRVMRISLLASGIVLLLFPLARSLPAVLACTLLLSVTAEAFRPANLTIVGDLVPPEQRKTCFAANRLAINLGMAVGPAVGGLLATISFHTIFLVDGATSIAAALILILSSFRRARHGTGSHDIADAVSPLAHLSRGAIRDRRLLFFLAAVFPVAVVFFQHLSSMPVFLVRDLDLSEAVYGLLFTLNCVLIVFLEVRLNVVTSHWPHRRTLALAAFLCGAGFGALAIAQDVWAVAATVIVWTFGEMLFFPGMADYLTEIAPARRRGEYMGLSQMVMGLAFMIGPWAGTQVLEHLGGTALWGSIFVCGAIAALMMLRLEETRPAVYAGAVPRPTTAPSSEP